MTLCACAREKKERKENVLNQIILDLFCELTTQLTNKARQQSRITNKYSIYQWRPKYKTFFVSSLRNIKTT